MRILLVEDQTILRELLIARLLADYPACEVTEAIDLAGLSLIAAAKPRFDLWIFDLELPDSNALEWTENWAKEQTSPKAIILSSSNEDREQFRALHSDLPAFVHKDNGIEMLQLAVKTVLAGGIFLSPSVQRLRSKMQADPVFFDRILAKKWWTRSESDIHQWRDVLAPVGILQIGSGNLAGARCCPRHLPLNSWCAMREATHDSKKAAQMGRLFDLRYLKVPARTQDKTFRPAIRTNARRPSPAAIRTNVLEASGTPCTGTAISQT